MTKRELEARVAELERQRVEIEALVIKYANERLTVGELRAVLEMHGLMRHQGVPSTSGKPLAPPLNPSNRTA